MKRYIYLINIVLLLNACSPTINQTPTKLVYKINVDSFGSDISLPDKKYVLVPADTAIDPSDLKYMEYAKYIDKILAKNGYSPAQLTDNPNTVIFVNYGISDPKVFERDVIVPVWGQVGVASSTTTIQKNTYGGVTGNTYNIPSYGVVGSNVVKQQQVQYLRYLTLAAYDLANFKQTGKEKKIWILELTSTGSSDDLRKLIPPMLVASINYIGKSSGEKKLIDIYEDNPLWKELKEN